MHNYFECLLCSYRLIFQQITQLRRFSERSFAINNPVDTQGFIVTELGGYPYCLGNKRIAFKYQCIRLPLFTVILN